MQATAILLAAGLGTGMRSSQPKTLHKIAGRSMLRHLIASCEAAFDRIVVVLGPDMEAVAKEAAPHVCVVQHERLGTAHAALQAVAHFGTGEVAVLYADNPLIRPATLRGLLDRRHAGDSGLALLAFRPADPARYGRVILQDGHVAHIVEWADATESERSIELCNAGVLCADASDMARWLMKVKRQPEALDVLRQLNGPEVAAFEAQEIEGEAQLRAESFHGQLMIVALRQTGDSDRTDDARA